MARDKKGRWVTLAGVLVCVALAWATYATYFADVPGRMQPFARTSLLTGRLAIWHQGLEDISASPWFGNGDRAYVEAGERSIYEDVQRVHNMFLETAMSYGLLVSMFALMVYVDLAAGIYGFRRTASSFWARSAVVGMGLVALTLVHTLFTTVSWTNLGDGPTVLFLVMVVPIAALGERVGAAHRARSSNEITKSQIWHWEKAR